MAVDMFLELDGIKGESADHKHKASIDIVSFSWGESNSGSAHFGGGQGVGKVSVSDLSLMARQMDTSSVALAQVCATGKHIAKGTLFVRKAGDTPLEFLKFEMTDILVTSFQMSGSEGSDTCPPSFSLNFAKFKFEYTEQKPDGSAGTTSPATYDIRANTK